MSPSGNSSMEHPIFKYSIAEEIEKVISFSQIDIRRFRKKNVLITGGTGFFGIWFVKTLLKIKETIDDNLTISVLSRDPVSFLNRYPELKDEKDFYLIKGEVENVVLNNTRFTHLIHMATTNAAKTFEGEDQLNKINLLYFGTKNILEQVGQNVESVLFTSSGVVYGASTELHVSEEATGAPLTNDLSSALGIGKRVAEYLVHYYSKKFGYSYSIARCFSFAGPYLPLDLHYAFGNFVQNIRLRENIGLKGDGSALRSYLYIGDAIAWLLCLVADPRNMIFNVGSEKATSIKALAEQMARFAEPPLEVITSNCEGAGGNFVRSCYVPSTEKIRRCYPHLAEWTDLPTILNRMLS
jgi:UDP-glucuronate decarboxylase